MLSTCGGNVAYIPLRGVVEDTILRRGQAVVILLNDCGMTRDVLDSCHECYLVCH